MQPLESYLTKEGWKRDLEKTRDDLGFLAVYSIFNPFPLVSLANLIIGGIIIYRGEERWLGTVNLTSGVCYVGTAYIRHLKLRKGE